MKQIYGLWTLAWFNAVGAGLLAAEGKWPLTIAVGLISIGAFIGAATMEITACIREVRLPDGCDGKKWP